MSLNREGLLKREIVKLGKFLYERGYVVATAGNISARLKNYFLITPHNRCKGEILLKEISKVSFTGETIFGRPSMEWRLHLAIYRERGDIGGIIHAHPPFLTLTSFGEKDLDFLLLPEGEEMGKVRFIPFFPPGSEGLAMAVKETVRKDRRANLLILRRHGVVVFGRDLKEARFNLERGEFFAFLNFSRKKSEIR